MLEQHPSPHYHQRQDIIHSLKTRHDRKRSRAERISDWMTVIFGSMAFLIFNGVWLTAWIVVNAGTLPGVTVFDPFPFALLPTVVSLEALILAIFVLISQNRAAKIAHLREEIDLQVDLLTEREVTKLLTIMKLVAENQGIDLSHDTELQAMLQPAPVSKIEEKLEEQVVGKAQL